MERKTFYIFWGIEGRPKFGNNQIRVSCTEEELDVVAHAIGDGNNADFLVVYDKPVQNPYTATPYKVYWDCM